ncbi:hypothetical protein PRIPAC_95256, partial [Pristionchus pacificus]|uniref:G protein-coupled receptor n=1 Tax=Pristionchus pacificus TaxID=54126 RepID=A0A2A6D3I8_PRIPA
MTETGWRSLREAYASLVVVAAAGICLNILILLTTICTKSLPSTAHILIGCCAFFDILHEIGHFIQFPILFSEYYIHSFTCSCMQFIPVLGRSAAVICSFCIGIDRMLCMLDAVVYERMKKKHLHAYYVLSVLLFCIWTAFLMIVNWTPKLEICTMLAPFHGDSRVLLWNTISGIYILISLIYFITWQTVKWTGDAASQTSNNVYTTITIVMIVEVST